MRTVIFIEGQATPRERDQNLHKRLAGEEISVLSKSYLASPVLCVSFK